MQHQSITHLQKLIIHHQIKVTISTKLDPELPNLVPVTMFSHNQTFELLIQDEYNDLKETNQPMCLLLILFALEEYELDEDFLAWARSLALDSSNWRLKQYYSNLNTIHSKIKALLGNIDPPISSFDYQLGAGGTDELRELTLSNGSTE